MFLKIMAIWTTFIKPWKLGIHSAEIDAVENLRFCAPLFRAVLHSFSRICTAGKLRRLVVSQHLIVSLPVILLPASSKLQLYKSKTMGLLIKRYAGPTKMKTHQIKLGCKI